MKALTLSLALGLAIGGDAREVGAESLPVGDDVAAMEAAADGKQQLGENERKIDSTLRTPPGPSRAAPQGGPEQRVVPPLPWERGTRVRVIVTVASVTDEDLARLREAGLEIEIAHRDFRVVQGWIERAQLLVLAGLPVVERIEPALPPQTHSGAARTEGDALLRADLVRAARGYDGTGVVVGVISNGIDHLATAQASGDLGVVAAPNDPRCQAGSADEGVAMLEIVHDVAPGAVLLFSAGPTWPAMIDTIRCLAEGGARVIVDDLGFDEPFFEDGPVAQTVRAAVQAGVSYHTAAGNYGTDSLAQPFRSANGTAYHNFAPQGVDILNRVTVPAGGLLLCMLQWDEPVGGATSDYDVYAVDPGSNTVLAKGDNDQSVTRVASETVALQNPFPGGLIVGIGIKRFSGTDHFLRLICRNLKLQYATATSSIYGHQSVSEAVTVAAVDVRTPGLATVNDFSSRGPPTIVFPVPEVRYKPDVTSFDGVSVMNAGGFPGGCPVYCGTNPATCPGDCRFTGTSAAAPHSAAVAALMLSKNSSLSPADIQNVMRATAIDLSPAGFDWAAGAGRLDALAAVDAVSPGPRPCLADSQCNDGDLCTTDVCDGGRCVHGALVCDDGVGCTVDRCEPSQGTCSSLIPHGLPGLDCALQFALGNVFCRHDYVPSYVRTRFRKATTAALRALTTGRRGRQRAQLRAARTLLRQARRRVVRVVRVGDTTAECGATLTNSVDYALRGIAERL